MRNKKKIIVVFSKNYPSNPKLEHSFLKEEIKLLKSYFSTVYIVPFKILDNNFIIETHENLIFDKSFSKSLNKISLINKLKFFFNLLLIKEIILNFNSFFKFRKVIGFYLNARVTEIWITNFIKKNKSSEIVFYSFWNDVPTLGMVLAKQKHKIKTVTRCHNYDLYGNFENKFYVPFFKYVFSNIDRIFPDSENGFKYLKGKLRTNNIYSGIMGVKNDFGLCPFDDKEIFTIVSCSHLIKRKRVNLILDSVKFFSNQNQNLKIKWIHIGDGPEHENISKSITDIPDNCEINLLGYKNNEDLHDFYQNNSIDVFINTSTKEGTPVSIIEAISYGIPILATAFGGGMEIVKMGAGELIKLNPTIEEISKKLLIFSKKDNNQKYRKQARKIWETKYNSEKIYKSFAKDLLYLLK